MRQFIVLGFKTTSTHEDGELMYLGRDRGKAFEEASLQTKGIVRKCVYEIAVPQKSRFFPVDSDGDSLPNVVEESDDVIDDIAPDVDPPDLTESAQELADLAELTAEQIAEIVPTGSSGDVLKKDVEDYLEANKIDP